MIQEGSSQSEEVCIVKSVTTYNDFFFFFEFDYETLSGYLLPVSLWLLKVEQCI